MYFGLWAFQVNLCATFAFQPLSWTSRVVRQPGRSGCEVKSQSMRFRLEPLICDLSEKPMSNNYGKPSFNCRLLWGAGAACFGLLGS